MKKPINDEECRALLRNTCGRTEEQIDAIFEFVELTKELKANPEQKEVKKYEKRFQENH